MLATFNASAPIALIILLGYVLNRYKVPGPEIWSALPGSGRGFTGAR